MLGSLVRGVLFFPLAVKNRVWRLIFRKKRIPRVRLAATLPVVGLDERFLQSHLFALKQASAEPDLIEAWLTATQLTQIVIDRLLKDMRLVESNLEYWQWSLNSRHHAWLMFFQRGPVRTFKKVLSLFKDDRADLTTATDMIEQRIFVLRSLESLLLKALADVHAAAVDLRLGEGHAEENDVLKTLDLPQTAHVCINKSLWNTSHVLRNLRFESSLLHDRARLQRQISAVALIRNASSVTEPAADNANASRVRNWDDAHKESSNATYGITMLHELIAKVKDRMKIDVHCPTNQSLTSVLEQSRICSMETEPFVRVPYWARQPNRLQRNWIVYSIYGIISLSVLRFLINHSPLTGSDAMYKWAQGVKFALEAHIIEPLTNLTEEVFDTFHGAPGIVSREDYEVSKQSLIRMLKDFKEDASKKRKPTDVEPKSTDTVLEGMDTLMRTYESELKKPVWNMLNGQLARALLIQVQKLKVDTESAMLELDQILRANELNVALIAAIPAILIGGGLLYFLSTTIINRTGPDPYKSLIPCRLALVELQRALNRCQETAADDKEALGNVMYRLEKTYRACWNVFRNRDIDSERSEWSSLRNDFIDLSRPSSVKQNIRICERMRVTYSVFQIN